MKIKPLFSGERHTIRGWIKSAPNSVERSAGRNQGDSEKYKSPEHEGRSKDSRKAKLKDDATFPQGNAASSNDIHDSCHNDP